MKTFNITVNGIPYSVTVEETAGVPAAAPAPAPVAAAPAPAAPAPAPAPAPAAEPAPAPAPAVGGTTGAVTITAPMPGNILDVKVSVGSAVKTGDVLCVLEAMKMENEIVAPQDGTIASVNCTKGDVVNAGDLLVSLN